MLQQKEPEIAENLLSGLSNYVELNQNVQSKIILGYPQIQVELFKLIQNNLKSSYQTLFYPLKYLTSLIYVDDNKAVHVKGSIHHPE